MKKRTILVTLSTFTVCLIFLTILYNANADPKSPSKHEDLKKLRVNRKLGYMATGIIATAFAAEYLLGKSSYKSYQNATDPTDAQKYRDQNEMFTTLKTPTGALLGVSAGFTLYTTISLESLKTMLTLK